MEFLEKKLALIAAHPLPFLALALVVGGSMWTIASIYYSGQLATTKGQVELAEKQRDDFKSKLSVSLRIAGLCRGRTCLHKSIFLSHYFGRLKQQKSLL